jgi:hypothetical protein
MYAPYTRAEIITKQGAEAHWCCVAVPMT